MWRGSYGALVGVNLIGRSTGSRAGRQGAGEFATRGTKEIHSSIAITPSTSLGTVRWLTPGEREKMRVGKKGGGGRRGGGGGEGGAEWGREGRDGVREERRKD